MDLTQEQLAEKAIIYSRCYEENQSKRGKTIMKIGFIGCGNMASAMIGGILKKGIVKKEEIIVSNLTEAGSRRS